jgi:hypothetical protein
MARPAAVPAEKKGSDRALGSCRGGLVRRTCAFRRTCTLLVLSTPGEELLTASS